MNKKAGRCNGSAPAKDGHWNGPHMDQREIRCKPRPSTQGRVKLGLSKFQWPVSKPTPAENLKFERADWTSFRTVEGLQQKAGVAADKLRRLVLKELTDNGLDTGASVQRRSTAGRRLLRRGRWRRHRRDAGGYRPPVQHRPADGLDQAVAAADARRARQRPARCRRGRPRLGRLPCRHDAQRRIKLRPERDGSTTVVSVKPVDFPVGTRIEIGFGPAIPEDANALRLGERRDRDGARPVLHRQVVAVVVRRPAVS